MDKNIKTNDWFAARFLNQDVDAGSLIGNNVTPENSSLQSYDFYKNKPKVQEYFKKDDGTFDEKSYKEFYDNISGEYLGLSSANSMDFIFNEYEKNPNIFNVKYGKTVKKNPVFSFVENPLDQNEGVSDFNKWSDPTISKREAAQMNHYFDKESGKWSDETLNEAGFWGVLTGKSLVYATYDNDEYDENGNLIHQKGEWKKDEFGNYYAETVDNEEILDKQFVTLSEVLTDDNSAWNSVDIFDSDDLESNAWKTGLRTAAVIGSTFIPYVGPFIKYGTAALSFTKVLPQLTKTLNGLFNNDEFDKLNKWDNRMKRFTVSQTDEAKDNIFRIENLFNLIEDSYMQLAQQRAIATLPQTLGLTKKAEQAANNALMMQLIGAKSQGLEVGEETIKAMAKTSPIYKAAMKDIEKYSKVSHAISMAYLIGTSGGDTFNMAKGYGFDNFASSVISLATLGAYGTLFQTDYFRSMLTGNASQEEMKRIKSVVRQYLKNNGKEMTKDAAEAAVSNNAKVGFFKKWGKKISDTIVNHYNNAKAGEFGIIDGAINEGLEELVEEITVDGAIQLGKGLNEIRSALTGKTYTNSYSYKNTDPLTRYLMALGGGAVGGAVFKLSDILQANKSGYAALKQLLGDQKELEKEILTLVSQGKKDLIYRALENISNTEFANSNIDAITGESTDNYANSQNAVLISLFKKGIESIDSFLNNNGLKMDYDDLGDVEISKGLRVAYLKDSVGNNGIHKSLFNEYIDRINEIASLKAVKDNINSSITDQKDEESNKDKIKQMSELDKVIKTKIDELHNLIDGKDDSYIGRLMLETNPNLMNGLIPITKEALSKNLYHQNYDSLPTYLQEKIDKMHKDRIDSGETELNYMQAWNMYKEISSDESISTEFKSLLSDVGTRIRSSVTEWSGGHNILKSVDFKNLSQEDLYTESFRYLNVLLSLKSRLKEKYHLSFIGNEEDFESSFEYDYNEILKQKDFIISSLLGIENSFIQDIDYINEQNELLNIIKDEFFNIDNQIKYKNYIIERLKEIKNKENKSEEDEYFENRYISEENIKSFIGFINTGFDGFYYPNTSIIDLWNTVSQIYNKTFGTDINIGDIISKENDKINNFGDKYVLSDDVSVILSNLNMILGDNGILSSIILGSESTFNNNINGIPFGANNYINLAYREKQYGKELMEFSKSEVNTLMELFSHAKKKVDYITDYANKSQKNVINLHKKIGLKYSSARLESLQNLISKIDILNIDDEIKDKFKSVFDGYIIESDDYTYNADLNDEGFIETSAKMRNKTIEFEKRWYVFFSSLDEAQKISFVSKLRTKYGSKVEDDTSTVNSNTDRSDIFKDSNLWSFLALRSAANPTQLISYSKYIEATDRCPFDSQEEITIDILKYFDSDLDTLKIWFTTTDLDKSGSEYFFKLDSSGGVGKSFGIIDATKVVLDLDSRRKFLKFAANTTDQLNVISDENDDRFLISDIQKMINEDDKSLFEDKFKNSFLIIDECSHLSISELKKLNLWAKDYNVKIVLSGDTQQAGAKENFDYCFCASALRLDESLRAMSDIAMHNNKILGSLSGSNGSEYFKDKPEKTNLQHYLSDDGLVGIVKDSSISQMSSVNLSYIISRYKIPKNSTILAFYEGDIDQSLLSSEPIEGYNFKITNNVADIQGLEYDYVITNADTNMAGNNLADLVDKYRNIYTVLTRAKYGTVISSDIKINYNNKYVVNSTFEESKTKPVYSNIVSSDIRENFREFKKEVFKRLNLSESESESKPEPVIEYNDLSEKINEPEIKKIQIPTSVVKYDFDDQVEFATSFIPKQEITDDYAIALGFSNAKELLKFRFKAIEMLYQGKKIPGTNLILAKYDGISTDDLYNLGNANKDNKDVLKENSYIWLLLRTEKGDITLGMFQNLGLSQYGFKETKSNLYLREILSDDDKYPIGWQGKFEGKFTRVNNPLSISGNITDSNIEFTIDNGNISTPYSFMNVSAPFFFDPLGSQTIVDTDSIKEVISNINSLYKAIFKKLDTSKLTTKDYIYLSEIIGYDIVDGKIKYKAKGMPDVYHNIVSFVSISDNIGDSTDPKNNLKILSNIYFKQLANKQNQLKNIFDILESKSQNDAIPEIKEKLESKDLWEVSIIVYDSKKIEDESRLRTILSNLNNDKVGERSRKGFNISIITQLGRVFADLANIYSYSGKYNVSNEKYFTSANRDVIINFLDKHKNDLIAAYNSLNPENVTDDFNVVINWLKDFNGFLNPKPTGNYRHLDKTRKFQFQQNGLIFFSLIPDVVSDLYFGEDNISLMFDKINMLSRAKKNYKTLAVSLSGVLRTKLIDDNGHTIYSNDDNILGNRSFNLKSKVLQPATMRAFIKPDSVNSINSQNDLSEEVEVKKNDVSNNMDVDESPFVENEVIEETAVENETEITLESIKNEIIKRVDPDGKMNSRQRNKILTKEVIKSLESLEGKQLIDLYDYVFNNKDVSDANVIEIGNLILSKINPDDPRLSKDQETKVNC